MQFLSAITLAFLIVKSFLARGEEPDFAELFLTGSLPSNLSLREIEVNLVSSIAERTKRRRLEENADNSSATRHAVATLLVRAEPKRIEDYILQLRLFIKTLRASGYQGDIVVLMSNDVPQRFAAEVKGVDSDVGRTLIKMVDTISVARVGVDKTYVLDLLSIKGCYSLSCLLSRYNLLAKQHNTEGEYMTSLSVYFPLLTLVLTVTHSLRKSDLSFYSPKYEL